MDWRHEETVGTGARGVVLITIILVMARNRPPAYIRKRREAGKGKGRVPPERPSSIKRILDALGVVASVASIAGIAITILSIIPHLSIQVSGSVRPHDPFGTVFELSNDGVLPVHDVDVVCKIDAEGGVDLQNVGFVLPENKADVLSAGQRMTVGCHRAVSFGESDPAVAKLTIEGSYRPDWLWWHRDVSFPMEGIRADNGTWIWKQVAH